MIWILSTPIVWCSIIKYLSFSQSPMLFRDSVICLYAKTWSFVSNHCDLKLGIRRKYYLYFVKIVPCDRGGCRIKFLVCFVLNLLFLILWFVSIKALVCVWFLFSGVEICFTIALPSSSPVKKIADFLVYFLVSHLFFVCRSGCGSVCPTRVGAFHS